MKWCEQARQIMRYVIGFMDDERGSGHCHEKSWQVHRQYISKQQYLGIQDAPRKTRPPSQDRCGAWAGTVIKASPQTALLPTRFYEILLAKKHGIRHSSCSPLRKYDLVIFLLAARIPTWKLRTLDYMYSIHCNEYKLILFFGETVETVFLS